MDEIIPNPFEEADDDVRWDDRDLADKVETLRTSVIDMVNAMTGLLAMAVESKAHTAEHCDTFAAHADAFEDVEGRVKFLEQMLTGTPSEDGPQCECEGDE